MSTVEIHDAITSKFYVTHEYPEEQENLCFAAEATAKILNFQK
jgi:hypothetical protein